ncbi:sulfotransferase domain-containing protein [Paraneptunicella aestuarii]|uniref:sulfotransferase domain-containing protein n=1 Tax=Paraneptunicella aestuarii TaxID=2831148 RepID=UPI001E449838|nr:sulfotransferase domain-containing protein [Paraneptunicella aestuarii]UAA39455.1 sulfotransferase domain-containing protein [Paraneptunicella aestuarii]
MSANKKEITGDADLAKFFRAFELATEFREVNSSDKSLLHHLPRLIKGGLEYQFLPYYFGTVPKWRVLARKLFPRPRIAPNYVMTGPSKSGSSDLVSHLLLHPNVMPPLAKELRLYANKDWRLYYPTVTEKQALEERITGPAMCGYLEPTLSNMQVIETLHEVNPDCKIIITLRDPVARAYSYWKWEVFVGGNRLKRNKKNVYFQDFSQYIDRAIDLFPSIPMETICGPQVLASGMYYKAVEKWRLYFGNENVLVLDVAEYFQSRQPVFEKIQKFLGIPIINIPEYGKKTNENPIKLPPPDQATNEKLAAFYKPYNQKLFDLIGTEFNWL